MIGWSAASLATLAVLALDHAAPERGRAVNEVQTARDVATTAKADQADVIETVRRTDRQAGAPSLGPSRSRDEAEPDGRGYAPLPALGLTGAIVLAAVGVAQWCAQRRRVGALLAAAAQVRTLCGAAQIGFFRVSPSTSGPTAGDDVQAWDDTLRDISGAPSFAAFTALLSAEDRSGLEAAMVQAARLNAPCSVLVRVAHPERGARRLRVQTVPSSQHGTDGAWGHVQDETDGMAQMETAAHQQRIEMLGSLMAGVAHDFNNLLCALSLTLEAVRTKPSADQIDQAQRLVARGADLTAQLLAYARRQPLRCVPVPLDTLLQESARLLRQTLGPLHTLRAEFEDGIGEVALDPALLQTVLVRLALNARDAMTQGGVVSLQAGRVMVGVNGSLELGVPPGAYARLCVADHGIGLAADRLADAFDPFREPARLAVGSMGPVQAGTFSGLPMVYGFALQAGGAVQLRSGVEDGTQVVLYLPLPTLAAPAAPPACAVATHHLPRLRILLIEDDPDLRDCTQHLLEQQGASVTALGDGLTAVARLCEGAPYDLLLSDVVLPGDVSGFDIVEGARRLNPHLPALLISGYAAPERELGRQRPARTALLQKPFDSIALVAAIQDTMDAYAGQMADETATVLTGA